MIDLIIPPVYKDLPPATADEAAKAHALVRWHSATSDLYATTPAIARVVIVDFLLAAQGVQLVRK